MESALALHPVAPHTILGIPKNFSLDASQQSTGNWPTTFQIDENPTV